MKLNMKVTNKIKMKPLICIAITWLGLLLVASCSDQPAVPKYQVIEQKTAGNMTHKRQYASYIYPGQGVDNQQKLEFWSGFSFFRDPWITAPSATGNRDGLGPLFNTRSCVACHTAGSRAQLDKPGEILPLSLVVRLGSTQASTEVGRTEVDPVYGGQIQPRAIRYRLLDIKQDNLGEAWLYFDYTVKQGSFNDGEPYELLKPNYQLTKLAYGELAPHIGLSVRLAPNIYGMGLLDAIKVKDLLAQEDINDSDGDGISAKYNRVPNVLTTAETGVFQIGRFGFKAKQPNLHQQVAAAFRDDIGIINSSFSEDTCSKTQVACIQASASGGHDSENLEIDDRRLSLTVTFNALMGVPATRGLYNKQEQQGRRLFYQLACQKCHTPSYITGDHTKYPALAQQTIWPYTDLALHDMGDELADGVFEFDANGHEWRTPPLWGIGLQKKMTGQQRFLHDGRARTISEAILWHGGEAAPAKKAYSALTKQHRNALIKFIKAI
ncbi:MAG: di-heme oxidoredictase family protein [Colwellia sp.]